MEQDGVTRYAEIDPDGTIRTRNAKGLVTGLRRGNRIYLDDVTIPESMPRDCDHAITKEQAELLESNLISSYGVRKQYGKQYGYVPDIIVFEDLSDPDDVRFFWRMTNKPRSSEFRDSIERTRHEVNEALDHALAQNDEHEVTKKVNNVLQRRTCQPQPQHN